MKRTRTWLSNKRYPTRILFPSLLSLAPAPILLATTFRTMLAAILPALFLFRTNRDEVYNILWALVFGFATINILSLGARRFEQHKAGMNFGEVLAVLVVVVSVVLLGWEMLYVFGVLPFRVSPS